MLFKTLLEGLTVVIRQEKQVGKIKSKGTLPVAEVMMLSPKKLKVIYKELWK